nr:hypothetical protein [Tanacetum cinerariifolium]
EQPSYSFSISYTPVPSGSIMEDVLHSFVTENEPTQQLAYEDFEQVDQLEMEELDIKLKMAMLSLRINKFQKKAGRKINFNNKDSAKFDKRKARCYNCLQLGYFVRECNVKKVDEKARYSAFKISETEEAEQVYGLMAGFESDFTVPAGNAAGGVNPAAVEFAMMGNSLKAKLEKKEWEVKFVESLARFDKWKESSKNLAKLLYSSMSIRTKLGLGFKEYIGSDKVCDLSIPSVFDPEPDNREEWEVKFVESLARFDKWKGSSKNLAKLLYSTMSTRTKLGLRFKEYIRSDEVCDLSIPSVFDPEPDNREVKSLYERFVKAGKMHEVPPPITGTFMPTSYQSDLAETQATFGSKSNTSSIPTFESNNFVSFDNSDKSSASKTYDFASCVSSPKTNDSFSTVDVKLLPKSDVKDPSLTNDLPSCSFKENVKPSRNLYNFPFVISKAASVPAGSRNSLASISAGQSIHAASRNISASIHAGRSIPAASRNKPASIHVGKHIPAGRINKTSPFSADIQPEQHINCLLAKASLEESTKWHRRMAHVNFKTINKLAKHGLVEGIPLKLFTNEHNCVACNKGKQHKASYKAISAAFFMGTTDETFYILKDFIALIENQLNKKVKAIRCDNETEFQNAKLIALCGEKGIKRDYSNARTPQQNGVAERKNITLIEAARSMLADSKLPTMFWTEAVRKDNDGFLVGYAAHSKAYRVYNLSSKKVKETLNLRYLEDKPNVQGTHDTNILAGTQADDSESECDEQVILVPTFPSNSFSGPTVYDVSAPMENNLDYAEELARLQRQEYKAHSAATKHDFEFYVETVALGVPANSVPASGVPAGSIPATSVPAGGVLAGSIIYAEFGDPTSSVSVPAVLTTAPAATSPLPPGHSLGSCEYTTGFPSPSDLGNHQPTAGIFSSSSYDDDFCADVTNLALNVVVDHVATKRVNTIHPQSQIIGALQSPVHTRSTVQKSKFGESAFISYVHNQNRTNHVDHLHCLFACFLSQLEQSSVTQALEDPDWVAAMQEEMQQFYHQQVWKLVPLPDGKIAIGTKWILKNKGDARGIVVRNKARLVAQGHRQEKGIDYDEVFALVARIEAIRLFLAFASYMGFMVYQMDVKSAFLYGEIEEEVYVTQPKGFEDPYNPKHVYKVYVDDIIFVSTNKAWCDEFEVLMKGEFKMSAMGELTFFLGLQVKQLPDEIFISQDKYVKEMLNKFDMESLEAYSDSDYDGSHGDRKSTTGACQFLGRRLISWQCKKQTVVATSSTEAEYIAAASCCGQDAQSLDTGIGGRNKPKGRLTIVYIVCTNFCVGLCVYSSILFLSILSCRMNAVSCGLLLYFVSNVSGYPKLQLLIRTDDLVPVGSCIIPTGSYLLMLMNLFLLVGVLLLLLVPRSSYWIAGGGASSSHLLRQLGDVLSFNLLTSHSY